MREQELEEIRNRLNNVSIGPWTSYIEGRDITSGSSFIMTGTDANRGKDIELIGTTEADQDFIAAARQDIPKLLSEVYRLRKLLNLDS